MMMKEKKAEILYSDHVSEIISNPPGKIIRVGTTVIFLVFLLLILLSWAIKYPDIIPAPVEITTTNPPVTLFSRITGRINKLYVKEGEKVTPGSILAVMQTAASISDLWQLRTATDTVRYPERQSPSRFPQYSSLGELQPHYTLFLKSLQEYNNYIVNDFYGSRIRSVSEEIAGLIQYVARLGVKEKLVSENLRLEERKYRRDSLLYREKVLAESDFEKSRQAFITGRLTLQEVRLEQSAKAIEISEKQQMILNYKILREEERQKLSSVLLESWQNLRAGIKIWENDYLLISPVEGTVAFTKYWSENQSVLTGEAVMSVVPELAGDYIARLSLSMQRSGKVSTGQDVNIKLSGFPYLEFGMVRGKVKSKSLVPSGDSYVIEVSLPDKLTTQYGKKLEFTQNMQGTAEILTDDLRLIQKIIDPFRYLITRNRKLSYRPE